MTRTSTVSTLPTSLLVRRGLRLQRWRHSQQALLSTPTRNLAQVRPEPLHELWFTSTAPTHTHLKTEPSSVLPDTPTPGSNNDHRPPSDRTLALGRTLRTLSPLLPNILTTPLPPNILSPSVTLHLFPSTHPHLPIVKGRVAYRAALFTAPVAWGSVPYVGNVKLRILSEKIVRTAHTASDDNNSEEKLVVRWKTEGKPDPATSASAAASNTNAGLSTLLGGTASPIPDKDRHFSGLFIFTFDADGKISSHTIEHADEENGCERTSRVVTLTDWLLGKAKGRKEAEGVLVPGLGVAAEGGLRYAHDGVLAEVVRLAKSERASGRWRERLW